MYKLTIETQSLDELYNVVSSLRGKAEVVLTSSEAEIVQKAKVLKGPKLKKDEPVIISESGTGASADVVKESKVTKITPETDAIETSEVDYPTVAKATMDLVKAKGKPAALEILKSFGVNSAQELTSQQYNAYLVKVKAA